MPRQVPTPGRMLPSGRVSGYWPSPRGAGGDLAAATERAPYHQAGQAWARLGWEQVGWVDWDEQQHVLVLAGLGSR
jgi:hypothetical protein